MEYPSISPVTSEQLQKLHYDRIGTDYESHYGDAGSQQYRERFIHEPMFAGIELAGLNVLEPMSGSGQTTEYLLSRVRLLQAWTSQERVSVPSSIVGLNATR